MNMPPNSPPFICTQSGVRVPLLAPTADHINVIDIAYALARIPRFNGHTKGNPYSVAQHSVLVSRLIEKRHPDVPPVVRLAGLFHDAHEAYIGDCSTPVKSACAILYGQPSLPFEELGAKFDEVIAQRIGLNNVNLFYTDWVKEADLAMLAAELRDLVGLDPKNIEKFEGVRFHDIDVITPVENWVDAKTMFLAEYCKIALESAQVMLEA